MKHIVFYSGGIGSYAAAKRIIERKGKEKTLLLYTDTLIEDQDLYRFMIESAFSLYGVDIPKSLKFLIDIPEIPEASDLENRKQWIADIKTQLLPLVSNFIWIEDGRTPWQVFENSRWLGNSRLAQCSHKLKQQVARQWVEQFDPDQCTLYLGIDFTEQHRSPAIERNWDPYVVVQPMMWRPFLYKQDIIEDLRQSGINPPRLYAMGFSHNNCGGCCVKGGQAHWVNTLKQFPERFKEVEEFEIHMGEMLGKDVSILKKMEKRVVRNLKLSELRVMNEKEYDRDDIGGCGCFSDVE